MIMSEEIPTVVAPQVLLGNHLKALKLPTFAREYEKVAMESAQDRADYPRDLLRLCELERIDRERRNVASHSAGALSTDQELRYVRLRRSAVAEQGAGSGTDALRIDRQTPELPCSRAIRHRQNAYGLGAGISCLPEGLQCRLHDRGRPRA